MNKLNLLALLVLAMVLGILGPVSGVAATPVAQDATNVVSADGEMTDAAYTTTYLCQKCYNGRWCTVYTCYCYEDACTWYNKQPDNARILAQK